MIGMKKEHLKIFGNSIVYFIFSIVKTLDPIFGERKKLLLTRRNKSKSFIAKYLGTNAIRLNFQESIHARLTTYQIQTVGKISGMPVISN